MSNLSILLLLALTDVRYSELTGKTGESPFTPGLSKSTTHCGTSRSPNSAEQVDHTNIAVGGERAGDDDDDPAFDLETVDGMS